MQRGLVIAALATLGGCGPAPGSPASDTGSTTESGSTTGSVADPSSSETTASPVPCDATCWDLPPEWSGPFAVAEADAGVPLPECQGAFAEEHFTLNASVHVPNANCVCKCGDAFDFTCPNPHIWPWEGGPPCDFPAVQLDAIDLEPGCNPLPQLLPPGLYNASIGVLSATCSATVSLEPDDPPQITARMRVCGQTASCEEGTCPAPPAELPLLCVLPEGVPDGICPPEFPELRSGYTGIEDNRQCADDVCECLAESEDYCTATVSLAAGCDELPGLEIGECTTTTETAWVANVEVQLPPNPSATCWKQADSFPPTGHAGGTDLRYLCCQPPN